MDMLTSGSARTLYCQTCGYNLTGLTEERCPECGVPFSLELLRNLSRPTREPITLRAAVLQVLWPPGAYLVVFVAAPISVLLTGPVLLFLSLWNARHMAGRLAETQLRGRECGWPPQRRHRFELGVGAGLWFCQLAIAFGGCSGAMGLGLIR